MLLAMLAALAGCDTDRAGSADTGLAAVPAGPEVWVVTDWGGGEPSVSLDAGYALTFSVELLPCAELLPWCDAPARTAGTPIEARMA